MNIFKDLQIKFKTASIVQQLIYINVAAFIITLISSSFSGLYGKQMSFIYEWFSLSSSFSSILSRSLSNIYLPLFDTLARLRMNSKLVFAYNLKLFDSQIL